MSNNIDDFQEKVKTILGERVGGLCTIQESMYKVELPVVEPNVRNSLKGNK